jgi:hypothetical protein
MPKPLFGHNIVNRAATWKMDAKHRLLLNSLRQI